VIRDELGADEHRWARVWAGRGAATPAETSGDRTRRTAGITAAPGDTVDLPR